MKPRSLLHAFVGVLVFAASAWETAWADSAPIAARATASTERGLLWRVEGASRPSFLFGTIHSEDPRVVELSAPVKSALDGAGRFVMELVPDEDVAAMLAARMVMTDGRSLKGLLGGAAYATAVSALGDRGVPPELVERLKPWAVVMMLSMPAPKGGLALDLVLLARAKERGEPAFGLETAQEQLSVFDGMPMSDQIEMARETLKQVDELPAMLDAVHNAYLSRDLGRLNEINLRYSKMGNTGLAERLMTRLLAQRNQRMAQRMETYLKQGNAFIAVGALHLPGREGLLNLLRQRGYRVTAVW